MTESQPDSDSDLRDLIEGSLRADPERVSKRYTRHYYDLKLRLSDEEWQQFVSIASDEYDVDAEEAAQRGRAHREELDIESPYASNLD